MHKYNLKNYQYDLPQELIAQTPHDPADMCKMLVIDRDSAEMQDRVFIDISQMIDPDTVIVVNNSKVIKSRIVWGDDDYEVFFLNMVCNNTFSALVRPGRKLKTGSSITYIPTNSNQSYKFEIIGNTDSGRIVKVDFDIYAFLEKYGQMPLPPYISDDETKYKHYQPIRADDDHIGSVASPTASLHFTQRVIDDLNHRGITRDHVTLDIGLGTFQNINTSDITDYQIHSERISVDIDIYQRIYDYKSNKKNILAIGTTSLRTLESLPYLYIGLQELDNLDNNKDMLYMLTEDAKHWRDDISRNIANNNQIISHIYIQDKHISADTKLYITPGYNLCIVDSLITNFHLSGSSLLVLVSSILGYDLTISAYQHAIVHRYRFFSFGDCMWIR